MIRALWGSATSEEESRASLQARLTALSKLVFWAFAALIAFQVPLYYYYPDIEPQHQSAVYVVAAIAFAMLAFVWRVILVRRTLSVRALYAIDTLYMIMSGGSFGIVACLTPDLQASLYTSLIYASFTVLTRALLVPSDARRTAILSTLSFIPLAAAAAWLGYTKPLELPGGAFFTGDLLFNTCAVLLATTGSHIIYGLRRQVSEAQQLGVYRLDRKIGEGGMGAVYRAHHILLRRPTAIKLLLPDRVGADNLERFEREVQHMSRLTHPNTVAVFDYGRSEGVFYYAMEYLGGGINLEDLVRKHGPQPGGRVAHVLVQVCGALQEAHDARIIHRDIKPANIILCQRGGMPDVAKVVDFGLVKEITADTGASTQIILGTPHYIAPEAITEPSSIGPAVDLYALGCVGYFLLTGRRVFEGKTSVDVCIQHVTAAPPRPSEITRLDPALEAIVMKCLAKAPGDRHASAVELAEALLALAPAKDWSAAEARRWWRDFEAIQAASATATETPTRTITVDLGHRDDLAGDVRSA